MVACILVQGIQERFFEGIFEHCEGVVAHVATHCGLEAQFSFLGSGQAREFYCTLCSVAPMVAGEKKGLLS